MSTPLISVITPTYQCAATLPWAIASLLTQTYSNWECVIIDDGSDDGTQDLLHSINDPRIRSIALSENQGRGFARGVALREAAGDFITSLDADDWIYSNKLEIQLQAFRGNPALAAVTVGMAVTSATGRLIGVQGRVPDTRVYRVRGPLELKFPLGPTMVRAELAREVGFDAGFRRGGDRDFFLRLLCGKNRLLCHLPEMAYVYRGHTSRTISELLLGHECNRRISRDYFMRFPLDCAYLLASSYFKSLIYRAADVAGLSDWVSRRRFLTTNEAEREEYRREKARLDLFLQSPAKT